MDLSITGRHVDVTDNFRDYVEKKIDKINKYFHQIIDVKVIIYKEKINDVVEIIVFGDGVQFHGIEKSGDFYSAYDLLMDKLEQQVKKNKEKHQQHKGVSLGELPIVDITDESDNYVKVKTVSGKPFDEIEAYLQMKVNKQDFILFKKGVAEADTSLDYHGKNYSVLYNCNGNLKMVSVSDEMLKNNDFSQDLLEYELSVDNPDSANPSITKKTIESQVKKMSIADAVNTLFDCDANILPFFNTESNLMNVLSTRGSKIEVFAPEME